MVDGIQPSAPTPPDDGGQRPAITVPPVPSVDSSSAVSPAVGNGDPGSLARAFATVVPLLRPVIQSAVRHGVTSVGTALGVSGLAADDDITAAVGGLIALVGWLLSVADKARNKRASEKGPNR